MRTDVGTITQTDFGYTGQRSLDAGMGGMMDYKARFYSPYLNHFTQPDSIIPDAANPQAWNRYSYSLNNPIRYNDPDGHCPTCATAVIGAALGAIVGAASYVSTTYVYHRSFSVEDYDSAIYTGVVGGALIGTGIGIGNPAISKPLIGAGVGVIGSQVGYSITAGKNYQNDEMVISAGVGAVSGALTGGVSASSTGGLLTRAAIEGVAGSEQYILTENANGRIPDTKTAIRAGINSSINSLLWDSGEYVELKNPSRADFFLDRIENVGVSQKLKDVYSTMLRKSWSVDAFKDIFRSSISYMTGHSMR